ncbi:DUF3102 domain-containing protein [Microbaculum marinum]|uniref:DUF3102 domain-containing protein n=1 Tax=Microbaculum marinum TaxID=1764581 RepID=A0AAW9RYY9_9HYPH
MTDITTTAAFDYSIIDADTAHFARKAAFLVRARHQSQIRMLIETGSDLLAVKERLPHGRFGAWLKAEFGWTERTAQNYMQAALAFRDKSETISELPQTLVYKLAAPSTPPQIRDRVVADLEAGRAVDPVQIKQEIAEAVAPSPEEMAAELSRKRIRQRRKLTSEDERRIDREQRRREADAERRRQEDEDAATEIFQILGDLAPDAANRLLDLIQRPGVIWAIRDRREVDPPATPNGYTVTTDDEAEGLLNDTMKAVQAAAGGRDD